MDGRQCPDLQDGHRYVCALMRKSGPKQMFYLSFIPDRESHCSFRWTLGFVGNVLRCPGTSRNIYRQDAICNSRKRVALNAL